MMHASVMPALFMVDAGVHLYGSTDACMQTLRSLQSCINTRISTHLESSRLRGTAANTQLKKPFTIRAALAKASRMMDCTQHRFSSTTACDQQRALRRCVSGRTGPHSCWCLAHLDAFFPGAQHRIDPPLSQRKPQLLLKPLCLQPAHRHLMSFTASFIVSYDQ